MSPSDPSSGFDFLIGRCDEVRAEVFVRAQAAAGGAGARITGTLTGPRRGRDTTLPATARLQPTAQGGLARAIVTEPAYWTPDLPNLYRLEALVDEADAPRAAIDRLVGLRRLGVRGRSLWLDGHRWVPRAVRVEGVAGIDACKPAALAALVSEPDEATLDRADEIGVAVLALLSAPTSDDPAEITRAIATWAAHPSAVITILPASARLDTTAAAAAAAHHVKGTHVLAAAVPSVGPPPASIPAGIDLLVVSLDSVTPPHEGWRVGSSVPLIAWRRDGSTPVAGRGPCDDLQASLADWGTAGGRDTLAWDWAGYVVG